MSRLCQKNYKLNRKMSIKSIFYHFIIKMRQSILFTVLDRPFCRTEIHSGRPYLCCSPTPMVLMASVQGGWGGREAQSLGRGKVYLMAGSPSFLKKRNGLEVSPRALRGYCWVTHGMSCAAARPWCEQTCPNICLVCFSQWKQGKMSKRTHLDWGCRGSMSGLSII